MPKVILYIAVSLDGFIATPDGGIDWLLPYQDSPEDYGLKEFDASVGALIMGANSYRKELSFGRWSHHGKKCCVLSSRPLPVPQDAAVDFYSGDLKVLVERIKRESENNIWLVGGGRVVTQFINEGLLEEMMLFYIPVFLSRGIPLFAAVTSAPSLTLVNSKAYPSGVVRLHYSLI
ncbi:MAG: dihydrofolate reductase family protein [Candidatus Zixiibacteriota bacterium]